MKWFKESFIYVLSVLCIAVCVWIMVEAVTIFVKKHLVQTSCICDCSPDGGTL